MSLVSKSLQTIVLTTRTGVCKWDRPVATLHHSGPASRIAFHAYDPHVFVANDTSMLSVYDWTRKTRLMVFNNGNPSGTTITSLSCINQNVGGLLMAGSSDGVVHLYRNYDASRTGHPLQMVTSFRALPRMTFVKRGAGLILGWQQNSGLLIAGGDSRTIRLWDAHKEKTILVSPDDG